MKKLYTLLYAFSLILINPWGGSRGEIWTQPKVFVVLLIVLSNLSFLWEERKLLTFSRQWKICLVLWGFFLTVGAISTLQSPFPERSFWGQDQMGDGWLYWLLISIFSLTNRLLLKLHPELFRCQMRGLLIGAVVVAVSVFPQVINWQIDYTATNGQLVGNDVLASTIFRGQQPIALYSHRGHAAIVLTLAAVISLVGWKWKLISDRTSSLALFLILPALLFTNTRTAIVSLMIALFYLLGRQYYKQLIPAIFIGLLAISAMTFTRPLDWNRVSVAQVMSSRDPLWELAVRGIQKRPLFGWGFGGFGIAYPFVTNPNNTPEIVNLGQFSYDYIALNGQVRTEKIPSYKAHNLILDTAVSTGILGLLACFTLWGYCFYSVIRSPNIGIEAVAIAYTTFAIAWFESAEYAHIFWWALDFSESRFQSSKFTQARADSSSF
ncbi:MAG: O-antigen ligase family protein [Microcoleus sp. PH2017_10_PVI_O_A]|uniref:O-antigen ligase family protein n=1 Tax=unclassified Microcoleus TaxID=2642155 RepID=UPI001DE9F9AC|nr:MULTISPECIES: O-antigen ligase family protein [unclassified Microcoleus]TAE75140.1 MAG: O-antigen polymerase [Oscillatoriales cyanobacterium]MCC3408827.1 O-antigen ligase family protein [Microcoleus sp. PH2017_10_PVI_O_A]MCC3462971.1 O-antigen ligase family protein [Microcoleus sp. PH2017_11_PCY_U_A]MCC3481368.1 O-antigen ligase family protein [Microcoleus sp. PH2017_12_PCY_D_A]MCC3527468.1 O-antigen ligase family protein [Microcoleus sp. PH2017_21_RUC_O_A]